MVEEEDPELSLHVSVGGVTIEVSGPVEETETWFEALQEDYLADIDSEDLREAVSTTANSTAVAPNGGEGGESTGGAATTKSRSLTEYFKMADDPTKKDSALIVGWYLEYHSGQDDFTRPEVEEEAKNAKVSLGENVTRDLSYQVGDGHIKKVDERNDQDAYHLTITGEEYVEGELLGLS